MLDGKILLREHSLDSPYTFKIVSMATSGTILGVEFVDNNLSRTPFVFSVIRSKKSHLVVMPRSAFDQIWKVINERETDMQR